MIPELFWLYNTMFVQIIHPVTLIQGGTGKVLFEHHKEREDFVNGDISSDPRYLEIIEQMQRDVYISPEPVYREWTFNYTLSHNSSNTTTEILDRTFRFRAMSMKGEGNPFDIL